MAESSDSVDSSFTLTIGAPQTQASTIHASVTAVLGGPDITSYRTELEPLVEADLLNRELPVLVFDCSSVESAEALAWTLTETWKLAISGDSPDSFFSHLALSWKKDDVQLVSPLVKTVGKTLILTVELCPWLLQHYKTYTYLLFNQVGDILAHRQSVDVGVEIGGTIGDFLGMQNLVVGLFTAFRLSSQIKLWSGLSERLEDLLERFVKNLEVMAPFSFISLFTAGNINLSFRSFQALPRQIKEVLPPSK